MICYLQWIEKQKLFVPIIITILFSLYHFWLPLIIYFVYWHLRQLRIWHIRKRIYKQNIFHCLCNFFLTLGFILVVLKRIPVYRAINGNTFSKREKIFVILGCMCCNVYYRSCDKELITTQYLFCTRRRYIHIVNIMPLRYFYCLRVIF